MTRSTLKEEQAGQPIEPHDLIPPPAHDRIDHFVQRWVAGTNGKLYISAINKLNRYPIPCWPGPRAPYPGAKMLDIGCGWGRWMVAAAQAGWTPFGIDLKSDAAAAANRVLKIHHRPGCAVAGNLTALPFPESHFDLVFSYSVLQHVSRDRARRCLAEVLRVLKPGAFCLIELPLYPRFTNWRHGKGDPVDLGTLGRVAAVIRCIREFTVRSRLHLGNWREVRRYGFVALEI